MCSQTRVYVQDTLAGLGPSTSNREQERRAPRALKRCGIKAGLYGGKAQTDGEGIPSRGTGKGLKPWG